VVSQDNETDSGKWQAEWEKVLGQYLPLIINLTPFFYPVPRTTLLTYSSDAGTLL